MFAIQPRRSLAVSRAAFVRRVRILPEDMG
jgi:hypothetical protein